jgi:GTP-dependent phosphoenolpyruvate carboxykinase
VDVAGWKNEVADVAANYVKYGGHLPKTLNDQLDGLKKRLG